MRSADKTKLRAQLMNQSIALITVKFSPGGPINTSPALWKAEVAAEWTKQTDAWPVGNKTELI